MNLLILITPFLMACTEEIKFNTKVKIICNTETEDSLNVNGKIGYVLDKFTSTSKGLQYKVAIKGVVGFTTYYLKRNCLKVVK